VRLAESTWSTWEPHDGVYDFSKLDHVLDAMDKAGIHVIVGTPTDQGKRQLLIGGAGSGKVVWTGTAEPACSARQRYPFLAW
jgi:beta-galactosidase GanA